MFKPRDEQLEPAIIIVAIKNIEKGKELFYEYGDHYWTNNKKAKKLKGRN